MPMLSAACSQHAMQSVLSIASSSVQRQRTCSSVGSGSLAWAHGRACSYTAAPASARPRQCRRLPQRRPGPRLDSTAAACPPAAAGIAALTILLLGLLLGLLLADSAASASCVSSASSSSSESSSEAASSSLSCQAQRSPAPSWRRSCSSTASTGLSGRPGTCQLPGMG
jgi:hypothetical protein